MTRNELFDILYNMILILGAEYMLYELSKALSNDELEANLKYIANNHDLSELFED